MRNSENITGQWKSDRITFTIATQYFHTIFVVGYDQPNPDTEEIIVWSTSVLELALSWGGDLFRSTTLVTLHYRVEQIRKCDMDSVHNRQQRGWRNFRKCMCLM